MQDRDKTHTQLLQELAVLRERFAQAETLETERKRLEEALRVSEERYHNLFERVPIGLYRTTPEGQILDANPALVKMLGYPDLESLLAIDAADTYLNAGDRRQWRALIDHDGVVRGFETQWIRHDEAAIWVRESAQAVRDDEGQLVCYEGSVEDITERKRAEQLLRALNQVALVVQRALTPDEIFAAAAAEFKRLGIFSTFLLMNDDQSKLFPRHLSYETAALQAAEKFVGLKLEGFSIPIENVDVYRKAVWDREATFVENAEEPLRQLLPKMARRFAGQIARLLKIPKTIVTPLIVEDKVIGVLSVESDNLIEEDIPAITAFAHQMAAAWRKAQLYDAVQQELAERRQAEEALRLSEVRFRSLIEETSDAVFCYEYDPPIPTDLPVEEQVVRFYQGTLVECNDVCARSYGATRAEEVTGQKLLDLFGTVPGSLDAFFRAFIQDGYRADGLEGTEVVDDGTERHFLNNGHGVLENGMLIRVWGTFQDITERTQAEAALRQSEQRFRHFFEKAPGYCYMISPAGTIQDVNEAALEALGYEKGELVGKPLAMIYAPDSLPRMKQLLVQWEQTGELDNEEIVIITKAGEKRTVLLSAGVVRDQDGQILHSVSVQRDITVHKQAEVALRQSEEKFRTLAEKSPNMIFINKKGRVVYANEKSEELMGYTREEFYSPVFDFLTLIAPESIETVRAAFNKHMQGEEVEPYEYTLISKDGKRIEAIITTTLIDYEGERAILGIATDITERVRAEEALRRSEERYRQIFENSPISLWEEDLSAAKAHLQRLRDAGIRDFRNYFVHHPEAVAACAKMVEVLDVNKATMELYQVDSKEALRGELARAFAPESYDAFREELIAIAEGKTTFESDTIVETLAGQARHTLTRWSVAPGHEDALSRVLVSIIDITERRQAEDALRRRFAQLALINEIGSKLTAALDLEQVLDLAARLVQEKFNYHHVAVFAVDRARDEVVMRARTGSYLSLFPPDYRLGKGEGMVGWVALHGEKLLANDVAAEPRYVNAHPERIPTRSELSVPIRVAGEVIGVLDAQSPHLAAFDENDVMVMETVADQIAVAIEDARLYEAIQRELAERRRVEEELRRSEEKFRNIIESIPVGMHMYQLEPDGRLVFMDANPAADQILGVDNRQFVAKTLEEAFPALSDSEIPARYRQVASDGQTRHWDDIYYEENQISGAFEVHAFQTSPGRMAAAFLDITERKQAEDKIRQQNEFLNSVLESLTHPFYVINASDYSVEVANSAARQGRSLDGLTCFALSHHRDRPCNGREHPCLLERVMGTQEPVTVEHEHYDQGGNLRTVEVHYYPIVNDDGEVVQAIEYVLDITERKQAEQMLLQSERLAAMGRLAASVAHEINNPLQAVEGCLTLAKEELADSQRLEKVERYLGIAAGEIERIADIVRRVRDFYRPTVTGMQPTDVHVALESVLALANKQLQHSRVTIERAWDDKLPTIQANPDHLKQVFLNLILNAIDAMPDGGTLRLRTMPHLMPAHGDDPPPLAVYIEFSDTGQGMSPETQSRLFEPFFTTKEHGSGLGLYISHGIIESHKGQVNVTSGEGLGTTISILLPVEQP